MNAYNLSQRLRGNLITVNKHLHQHSSGARADRQGLFFSSKQCRHTLSMSTHLPFFLFVPIDTECRRAVWGTDVLCYDGCFQCICEGFAMCLCRCCAGRE